MSILFGTTPDQLIVDDPVAQLFLSQRVKEEIADPMVGKNYEYCVQYGRSKGIIFPAGVIFASYVRWLRFNEHQTLTAFLALNDAHSVFALYLERRYRQKVIYPSVFSTAPH